MSLGNGGGVVLAGSSLGEGLPRPFSVGSELHGGSSGTLGESEKNVGLRKEP